MNAAQTASFEEGTGGFITVDRLVFLIQAFGGVAVFLFVAWVCIATYRDYGDGQIKSEDLLVWWFRAIFLLMAVLYFLS